jgi:glycosyltransferase involved in cell wall biosynthesis
VSRDRGHGRGRRVLMFAYFFPPLGGTGAHRTVKYVKYLPRFGWDPIVVTTSSRAYAVFDPSLWRDVGSDTPILRAWDPSALHTLRRLLIRLRVRYVPDVLGWPDAYNAWLLDATRVGLIAVRRYQPDVLYTTSAPYTAHLAGLMISGLTKLPWIADFRDEWASNPYAAGQPQLLQRITEWAEAEVGRRATRIVVAGDYFSIAGNASGAKRVTITNGVDPDDVPTRTTPVDGARFRLAYIGTLYGPRDAGPVARALEALAREGAIDARAYELRIVGNAWLQSRPTAGPCTVVHTGYVDHARAFEEMTAASALLLYEPPGSRAMTGKVFEYLASTRPVLCVAPRDSLAFRVVSELGGGICVEPHDANGIRDALLALFVRWQRGLLQAQHETRARVLERYSRSRLTGQLAETLDEVVATSNPVRGRRWLSTHR